MFVESLYSDRKEWEAWNERLRMTEEPPEGLVIAVAWDAGDRRVGQLNIWDTPGKVSDFYVEHVQHVVKEFGEPKDKPERHGSALSFYMRGAE